MHRAIISVKLAPPPQRRGLLLLQRLGDLLALFVLLASIFRPWMAAEFHHLGLAALAYSRKINVG